jgi:outer membrane protein assembly factor BamB
MLRIGTSMSAPRPRWRSLTAIYAVILCIAAASTTIRAEDWPEIRGKGRLGVWNEKGVLEKFPAEGLHVLWRTPIGAGYSGPAVANGRVFVMDFKETARLQGTERAIALDEKTGKILWTHEWPANYAGQLYASGPRATPTVDGDRVYMLGADGKFWVFNVETGAVLWKKDFVADLGANPKSWGWYYGFSSSPLVYQTLVICVTGGNPSGKIVAFDKLTGKEVWHAITPDTELGVEQPIVIAAGGVQQLIIWDPDAVYSLNPMTGTEYWKQPFKTVAAMTVATPVVSGPNMFVSTFYSGPLMLTLDQKKPGASMLWRGESDSEILTDKLHTTTATPVIIGDHIYGIDSFGQFRCLLTKTGERVWESQALTKERARHASGQIVRRGDLLYVNNDRGELVIVKPQPDGYQEISRTFLIKPTTPPLTRRELMFINWTYPAYANKHIYVRNDEEIIAASLSLDGK